MYLNVLSQASVNSENTHWHTGGLLLAHRLRRWPNIKPPLG